MEGKRTLISVRLNEDELRQLDDCRERLGAQSRSELIRRAVRELLRLFCGADSRQD